MPEDTVDGAPPPMLGLKKATREGLKTCVLTGEFAGFAEATCWLFNVRINRPGVDGYGQRPVFVDTRERRAWYVGLFQQCHEEIIRACEEGRLRAYDWETCKELSRLALRIHREEARLICADVKTLWSTEMSRPELSTVLEVAKTEIKGKRAKNLDQKCEAIIGELEDGVRPIGDHKNIPNNNEWIYRVQLRMRPDLFLTERSNSVRLLESIGGGKTTWPNRALKKIGLDRKTVDRILEKLVKENAHVRELLAKPGILPDLGDHPYPFP
jgi:hypothetical protein